MSSVKAHSLTLKYFSLPATFFLILLSVYSLYTPALNSEAQIDASANLKQLSTVKNLDTSLNFVFSGSAGPSGRPISLASFLIHSYDWPNISAEAIRINVLIHLLNGTLVFYLFYLLLKAQKINDRRAAWAAILATTTWLCSPLLVSTNLLIIQRMTSLSTLFVLLGVITYIKGIALLSTNSLRSFFIMSTGIGLGTLLAVLTKESGALLPIYALAVTPLVSNAKIATPFWFARWTLLFLWAPLLFLICYLLLRTPDFADMYITRGYSLTDRLYTESRILWQYLRLLVIPTQTELGPFQDDIATSRSIISPVSTLISLIGWGVVILIAIFTKKQSILPTFVLTWFLGGHLLESTALPLELYFEHRNYLPAIGVCFSIGYLIVKAPPPITKYLLVFSIALISLHSAILFQTTTLWGNPYLAAEIWSSYHPKSPRAQQFLAQQLLIKGEVDASRKTILSAWQRMPFRTDLALQTLQVNCPTLSNDEFDLLYKDVLAVLSKGSHAFSAIDSISKLTKISFNNECNNRPTIEQLHLLIDELFTNPSFQASKPTRLELHTLKALLYINSKNLDRTVYHLKEAFKAKPKLETALLISAVFSDAGLPEAAVENLENSMSAAPRNPFINRHWQQTIEQYKKQIFDRTSFTNRTTTTNSTLNSR